MTNCHLANNLTVDGTSRWRTSTIQGLGFKAFQVLSLPITLCDPMITNENLGKVFIELVPNMASSKLYSRVLHGLDMLAEAHFT